MDIGVKKVIILVCMVAVLLLSGCATTMKNFNRPEAVIDLSGVNGVEGNGYVPEVEVLD